MENKTLKTFLTWGQKKTDTTDDERTPSSLAAGSVALLSSVNLLLRCRDWSKQAASFEKFSSAQSI